MQETLSLMICEQQWQWSACAFAQNNQRLLYYSLFGKYQI